MLWSLCYKDKALKVHEILFGFSSRHYICFFEVESTVNEFPRKRIRSKLCAQTRDSFIDGRHVLTSSIPMSRAGPHSHILSRCQGLQYILSEAFKLKPYLSLLHQTRRPVEPRDVCGDFAPFFSGFKTDL